MSNPRTNEADLALARGEYTQVLELTAIPSNAPAAAWLDYDRASALVGLGRTDEAIEAFRRAEARFVQDDAGRAAGDGTAASLHASADRLGHAVSLWGRGRALYLAGRCADARVVFDAYADFVRLSDPLGAEMAAAYSAGCRSPLQLR
jgi:tetratricopeptide (TPR) repeat protein